jgi:hypothetical protein
MSAFPGKAVTGRSQNLCDLCDLLPPKFAERMRALFSEGRDLGEAKTFAILCESPGELAIDDSRRRGRRHHDFRRHDFLHRGSRRHDSPDDNCPRDTHLNDGCS